MVRCFLIHTICPLSALGPGESRVLYSRVFGPDEAIFSEQHQELNPEERRRLQKEKIAVVSRQVWSAASLSREASGRVLVEMVPGEEALALQEADSGVVRLRAGDPFSEEMSALWLGVQRLGFTLVCEAHENLLLAEGTLRDLTRHCLEQLHMLGQGSERLIDSWALLAMDLGGNSILRCRRHRRKMVLLRSNRIDALLSRLLPHGQLLFLNHRFAQSLEKEVATYMAK